MVRPSRNKYMLVLRSEVYENEHHCSSAYLKIVPFPSVKTLYQPCIQAPSCETPSEGSIFLNEATLFPKE